MTCRGDSKEPSAEPPTLVHFIRSGEQQGEEPVLEDELPSTTRVDSLAKPMQCLENPMA